MNQVLYQTLLEQLNEEKKYFQHFLHLLEDEANLLAGEYTHEAIHQMTKKKNHWHQEYKELQQRRQDILRALQLQNTQSQLEKLAEDNPKFKQALDSLLLHAQKAQELNLINGELIKKFLRHHQQALNMLESLGHSQLAATYDASGKPTTQAKGTQTQTKV